MFFAKVYAPLLAALGLFFVAVFYNFKDNELFPIEIFGAKITITSRIAGRLLCIIAAFSVVPYFLSVDFSEFFPDQFQMEVFYDPSGIRSSLSTFSSDELKELGYNPANDKKAFAYYEALDKELKSLLRYHGFFTLRDGIVHSNGQTSFKVIKTKGINSYYIETSKGELLHTLDRPHHKPIEFRSFFDKLPSPYDYVRPTITDILAKKSVLLEPRFRQVIAELNKSEGVVFDHVLVSATKVFLFPYPKFSNSVYFYDSGKDGLIPVGYAVYK